MTWLASLLMAALGLLPLPVMAEAPRLAIVKSSSVPPFQAATRVLIDTLRQAPVQPEILTFDLDGNADNADDIFTAVEAAAPAVIVSVGTLATDLALDRPSQVPLIFTMVLYPEQSGFLAPRRREVGGVSLDISAETQFDMLRKLLPKARHVGVLHAPSETGRVVEAARAGAAQSGFELHSVAIGDAGEAVAALQRLLPKVDAVWSVADSHVFTAQTTPALILQTLRVGVPMVGISAGHARAGAVMALYADYDDIGAQTAERVAEVLQGGRATVVAPRKSLLALNRRSASHIGLQLPKSLTRIAAEVIE